MNEHSGPWKKGAFFVCEKCGRREDAAENLEGFAEEMKKEFKSRMKEAGHGKEIRVMVSSCLSLCPPQKQTAAWFPVDGKVDLIEFQKSEKEDIFNWLLKKINS